MNPRPQEPADYPGFVCTPEQQTFWDSLSPLRQAVRVAKGNWLESETRGFPGYGPPMIAQADLIQEGD